MRLDNSEDTASKLVVSILDMELFFGFILSDSMIFNSFFNYTFICKKWVSELRRFGTTEAWSITASVRLSSRRFYPVSYTHLRAHETDSYLVCRLLLEKKKI